MIEIDSEKGAPTEESTIYHNPRSSESGDKDLDTAKNAAAEELTIYHSPRSSQSGGQNKKKCIVISVVLLIVLAIIFAGIIAFAFLSPGKEHGYKKVSGMPYVCYTI